MSLNDKINYLTRNSYENSNATFATNNHINQVNLVPLTNDGKYIFVCNL